MTLRTFVRLCRTYAALGPAAHTALDDIINERTDRCSHAVSRRLQDWLTSVQRHSGDDGELLDTVATTRDAIREGDL